MRKFIILFLNTGNGHLNAARVLAASLTANENVEVLIRHGFSPKSRLLKVIFEQGYNTMLNVVHGSFALLYELGRLRSFQKFLNHLVRIRTTKYLAQMIESEEPTDIVVVHYALVDVTLRAIKRTGKKINSSVIVTDPFTVPVAWFYNKAARYMVFSEEAKKTAVEQCGVSAEQVSVIPFLVNHKYVGLPVLSKAEIVALKKELGLPPDKKMVLLVGGGEGLPHTKRILSYCVTKKADFSIVIICGRNKVLQKTLAVFEKVLPNLHVLGFIDYLEKLVQAADCMVTKAGPAMILEGISAQKPLIICHYLHNQELGNMRFAVYSNVAYFIQSPKKIYQKIAQILTDAELEEKMSDRYAHLKIDMDASQVARLLLENRLASASQGK